MSQEDQGPIIRFLSETAAYPHAVQTVERLETHSSVVFLAGDRAYKMKRAIAFPLLDYSTLERRERFCRAEVELNRRTAPELYLGVVPVTQSSEDLLAIDGDGHPVEWLVVMRRFDQEDIFDHLASKGLLSKVIVRKLADHIAASHATAEVDTRFGGSREIARVIEATDRSLSSQPRHYFDAAKIHRLREESLNALESHQKCLDHRRREGKVRACHGDLHLRNILRSGDEVLLFDCIEFNEAVSTIDILYDLAFLLMDLLHRGHTKHANQLFNRYFDRMGELDGLPALPLFLSLRAGIRAHVGGMSAKSATDAEDLQGRLGEARSYLDFALSLLRPEPSHLIAVGGLSGTGKSTLSYELALGLGLAPGARVLRSDVIRKSLLGRPPEARLPPEAYGRETSHRVYLRLAEETRAVLASGYCAIADAVFSAPEEREAIEAVARDAGLPFSGLWLEAPADTLKARLKARRGDASDATAAVLEQQLTYDLGEITWDRLDAAGSQRKVIDAALMAVAQ